MKRETLEQRFAGLINELQTETEAAVKHQVAGRWGAAADTMESAAKVCKRLSTTAEKLAEGS